MKNILKLNKISIITQKNYLQSNGVFGALVHILAISIFLFTTEILNESPIVIKILIPILMIINFFRLFLVTRLSDYLMKNLKLWNIFFKSIILIQSGLLGVIGAILLSKFSIHNSSAMFFLVLLASISSASVLSFSITPIIAICYQFFLLTPSIIILPLFNFEKLTLFICAGIIFYLVFGIFFTRFTSSNILKILEQKELLDFQDLQLQGFIDSIPGYVTWYDENLNFIKKNKFQSDKFNIVEGFNSNTKFKDDFNKFIKVNENNFISNYQIIYEGETKYFLTLLSKNKINQSLFISSISLDVTELKLKELEVDKIREELIHQEKLVSLGEMAGGLAHEINNPLTVIIGRIQLIKTKLARGEVSPEIIEQNLVSIQTTSHKIKKIIDSLRSLARDSYIDISQSYPISHVVQSPIDMMESKLEQAGVKISIEIEDPQQIVYCGLIEVGQVLTNLIINSIHATENLENKWIKIHTYNKVDKLILEFKDSGLGISKEIQQKLFTPLFTTKGPERGNGIGLSLSKKIMNKMNGDMYYNENCENTCFVIVIPSEPTKGNNNLPGDKIA